MRAEIKLITPSFAKELLKMNVGNRRLKNIKNSYVGQMLNGEWKENGEPIIVDLNGFVKDGQHRLNAVIEANYSYLCPIIYDVDPDVMDTIDTGTNRSFQDVLELNGFQNVTLMSSLAKAILNTKFGRLGLAHHQGGERQSKTSYISNNRALNFVNENKQDIEKLVKTTKRLYDRQKASSSMAILSAKEIGVIIYILADFNYNEKHIDFINSLTGVTPDSNSSTFWIYKKLLSAKVNKVSLNTTWKMNAIIRTWKIFSTADAPISHLKINIDKIETVNK